MRITGIIERSDTVYNKYKAKPMKCMQGHIHDSKHEAMRCNELSLLQRAGEIRDLQQQVKYVLIPTQRETSTELFKRGANKGQSKPGKIIEKECAYYADFDYYTKSGEHVVEDTKGVKTKDYIIKRKLMAWLYNIRIQEL